VTVCRLAQRGPGSERGPAPAEESSEEDPRYTVALPWQLLSHTEPLLPSTPLAVLAVLLLVAVAVLVLPGAVVVWAIRQRAWLLLVLPLLWLGLCWAAVYLLFRVRLEEGARVLAYVHGETGLAWRVGWRLLLTGLVGLPAVAFAATVLAWLRRRRWVRLALLLAVSAGLAALLGWVWLALAGPLAPEKHYSWRGWYTLWPAGVYAAGVLLLAAFVVVRVVRLGRAGLGWLLRLRGRRAG
jgi:hypothetical protein